MSRRGIRIIPKTKDPMTPFVKLGMDRKWHLKGAYARNEETGEAGEVTFLIPDKETFVILRDDLLTGVHYFTVWGPGEEEVAREIRAIVEAYSEPELFQWWDRAVETNDLDDKVDAVLFLGVGAPSKPDEEYAKRIRAALLDPDRDVRNAAVVGAGYADWPLFRPDLERVMASDLDETARKRAAVVIESWTKELSPSG